MSLNTPGLVIREQTVRENDRLITILTKEYGIIRAIVYGAKKLVSSKSASTQLFAFSDFSISSRKDSYTVEHAVPKEMFFELRSDIESLSLAQYFAQLEEELAPAGENADEYLRLMLNSLHMLSSKSRPIKQIKAIFELRILSLSGYMPDIMMCSGCGKYDDEIIFFSHNDGTITCSQCVSSKTGVQISKGILHAMRHICYSEHEKIYNFSLSEESIESLSKLTEDYLFTKVRRKFKTLDFFYSII